MISWIIEGKINTDIIIQDFKQLQEPQPLQNHEICTSQSESDNESESDNYYSTDDTRRSVEHWTRTLTALG